MKSPDGALTGRVCEPLCDWFVTWKQFQSEENRTLCMTVQEYITGLLQWWWKEMKQVMDGREVGSEKPFPCMVYIEKMVR